MKLRRTCRLVPLLLAAALALPAAAGAAAWDTPALELAPAGSGPGALALATTSDGASWALWTEDPDSDQVSAVVAQRVSATGVPGERRVLATDGSQYGAVALAALSATDVRVAYVTGPGDGTAVRMRLLTPAETGSPDTLYDKDATDDGDVSDNGPFSEGLEVLAAPAGAAWVSWTRTNNATARTEARYVDGAGVAGARVTLADAYGASAATAPSGDLVAVYPQGPQGQVLATRVATGSGAPAAPIVLRPSSPPGPFFNVYSTQVTIDPAGIATAGWYVSTATAPGSYPEVRRFDAAATPMTTQGGGPTALTDGIPVNFVGYEPLLAADPDGDVIAAWRETTSWADESDVIARELGAGALPGTIGPRLQVDGPKPEGSGPSAVVPESATQTRVVFSGADQDSNTSFCRASRIGDGGILIGTDTIAAACASPVAPADAANGLAVLWMGSQATGEVRLSRWVEQPPTCSDGAAAQVQAGRSITLTLPCEGWRPLREIAGPGPARGTLGAIDQETGQVTYTAGGTPGGDEVRYRAVNAAGISSEGALAVTVTPVTPLNETSPSVVGSAVDGGMLTAVNGSWSGTPTISFVNQWQRCDADGSGCVDIAGATGGTYLVTPADVGSTIRVQVTASNVGGVASALSGPTRIVSAASVLAPALGGAPPPSAPPVAIPPADKTAPLISDARVMPRRIPAGSRGGPLLSFGLSEPATVKIRVQVRAYGRRSGGKCRTARKLQRELRRKRPCQTWLTVAGTTRQAPAGTSRLRLRGSKGRALPRGAYRVLVSATDAAGNRAREARPVFDVTR